MSIDQLTSQMTTLWRFDYEPKIKALRELYEVAKKQQWNAATDIPWNLEIDREGDILDPRQNPMTQFDFYQALPERKRKDLAIRIAAWRLSQFLHGEQGALLCCGQLVDVVPDTDGKLYAATQVVDEARHVEVFHRYITRLDRVYPIDPQLQAVLNAILAADTWQKKCVGMQIIVESLAMGAFKLMKEGSKDELLRNVVELTAQDEARHVSYGIIYLKDELPRMPEKEHDELEDFAFGAVSAMIGRQGVGGISALNVLAEVGVDRDTAIAEFRQKFSDPAFRARQPSPFRDYVIPQLQKLGLITERTAPKYREIGLAA
ncbi:MAG: ferritin-like domain-containing protein [Deltaproteobacteria bacterium]|nr:ferritin-like domain-containing protein [Deltaproteobacteria bacterium]